MVEHLSCISSPVLFDVPLSDFHGCVSYDGVCITVSSQKVSISIALSEIPDANYRHCVVLVWQAFLPRSSLYPKVSVFEVDCLSDVVLLW